MNIATGSCGKIPAKGTRFISNVSGYVSECNVVPSNRIIEVPKDKQVVWQFRLATYTFTGGTDPASSTASRSFYKAERISP
jgi:hypothetical protein